MPNLPDKSEVMGIRLGVRLLKIADLNIDPSYQRGVTRSVAKIVNNYIPEAMGLIDVGLRDDGSYWVVDGQQRMTARNRMGVSTIRCDVFKSKGPEHEALVFSTIQIGRTALKPLETFKASLTAMDPVAWAIKRIVEKQGFTIDTTRTRGGLPDERSLKNFGCVKALEACVKKNNDSYKNLTETVKLLRELWVDDVLRVHVDTVSGLSLFLARYPEWYDFDKAVRMFNSVPLGRIITAGRREAKGGGRGHSVCNILDKLYKKRERKTGSE